MHTARFLSASPIMHCAGEVPGPGGRVISQHALRQTPPPVDRMTDTCKNITFKLRLWVVTMLCNLNLANKLELEITLV